MPRERSLKIEGGEVVFLPSSGGGKAFYYIERGVALFHSHVLGYFSVYCENCSIFS